MKKNKFWTFVFACIPGAGQMYQGRMNRGVSFMVLFWGILAVSSMLYMPALTFALPVLWFYSFFDVMNCSNITIEQLAMLPDKPILFSEDGRFSGMVRGKHVVIGWAAILIGALMIYNMLQNHIANFLARYFNISVYSLFDALPVLIIGVVIILVGVRLLRGPSPARFPEVAPAEPAVCPAPAQSAAPDEREE